MSMQVTLCSDVDSLRLGQALHVLLLSLSHFDTSGILIEFEGFTAESLATQKNKP